MAYQSMEWRDGSSGGTPLNAENLNNMIEGIDEINNNCTVWGDFQRGLVKNNLTLKQYPNAQAVCELVYGMGITETTYFTYGSISSPKCITATELNFDTTSGYIDGNLKRIVVGYNVETVDLNIFGMEITQEIILVITNPNTGINSEAFNNNVKVVYDYVNSDIVKQLLPKITKWELSEELRDDIDGKEETENKVTAISGQAGTANDRLYPSVSAVWNFVRDYMFTSEDNFGNGVITPRTLSDEVTNVIDELLYTKADIETGEIHDNNEAWYASDSTKIMTGTYTLIGDICILKATCHRIADWGVVYYSLPVAAIAGAATLAVGTKIYSVSTDTQENISVLKIQNINGELMTNGTVSFTLVYPYKNF